MCSIASDGELLVAVDRLGYRVADGQVVLHDVTLSLHRGEILGIFGPNGCGKTTLLRHIAGLLSDDAGSVRHVYGKRSVGMIFQRSDENLIPWLAVDANVTLPARVDRDGRRQRSESASVLRELGLEWAIERRPWQLSGGEQQLVTLARWLANSRDVLLIDEGFSMLDCLQRGRAHELLSRKISEWRSGVVMVSHDLLDFARSCDEVLVMRGGPGRVVGSVSLRGMRGERERLEALWTCADQAGLGLHSG